MSTERLMATGRTPALAPSDVRRLLVRYFADDKPSLPALAEEFSVTGAKGVVRVLSLATIRKYLKASGIVLPRGRANDLPRKPQSVNTLMNRIPTEVLIGKGRAELLARKLSRGATIASLVREFGISKDRVRRLRDRLTASEPSKLEIEVAESVAGAADLPSVSEPEAENTADDSVV